MLETNFICNQNNYLGYVKYKNKFISEHNMIIYFNEK